MTRRAARVGATAAAVLLAACARVSPSVPPAPQVTPFPWADTVRVATVVSGVRYIHAWVADGPWAVHVLEIDRAACQPVVRARKAGPPLTDRATTSHLAGEAMAAINADFFALPGGAPLGPHVDAQEVLASPGTRPALTLTRGDYRAGRASLDGRVWARGDTLRLSAVNRTASAGMVMRTVWVGEDSTMPPAQLAVNRLTGAAAAGTGVVMAAAGESGDGIGLAAADAGAVAWIARRNAGDTIGWRVHVVHEPGGQPVDLAVGGYPRLLERRQMVMHEEPDLRPEFASSRHPRTAVGWRDGGERAWWVVVDGRQPGYSDGMTLDELTLLLVRLGAADAINLDGGGSSTMVIGGSVVNRPSDREGERAVGNALVLERCAA